MAKNNSKQITKLLGAALAVVGIGVIVLAVCIIGDITGKKQPQPTQSDNASVIIEPVEAPDIENKAFMNGIVTVEKVGRYAGVFVEDGSDEIVSDVFAITVVNNSEKMLQYAQVMITCGEESYIFDMSTIPAGARAQVLEKERKKLPESLAGAQTVLNTITEFQEEPSLYGDVFELSPEAYSIEIKNISESNISGDIYVYYKTKVGGLFMGGITYRAKVTDLSAGEEKNAYASHFYGDDSEILFVTYAK